MPLRTFPVAGGARYSNDWGAPRSGHSHVGNDLFGVEGTPLLAVDSGQVSFGSDPLGGQVAVLRADDGACYYYAHLSRFEGRNRRVREGEVIGYLGRTGNAQTTDPHVHFQVGGVCGQEPTNPFPLLQRAAVRRASKRDDGSLLLPILLATAAGIGYWVYASPREARTLARRWGVIT